LAAPLGLNNKQVNKSLKMKEARSIEGREQGLYRYHAERTRNQKSAYICRREKAGKETQGRTGWIPDKIWKVGIEILENLETATAKVVIVKRRK
jgi:hypothetical protein